ncbi:hypothetical protein ACSSS7_005397 [Eimeria intestinalis]
MNRCVLVSSIGPRILDDLALILNSLLVPSLRGCLASSDNGKSKHRNAAIPAEAVAAATSKPTSAQLLDEDETLRPAASSDSQLAENEVPWGRRESAQITEECEDVSPIKDADVSDLCPEEDQVVEPGILLPEGFTVDRARAAETLDATLELLNQITATSTTMMTPLQMPATYDATDNSPEAIDILEDLVLQWQQVLAETVAALMDALRMVWVTSRHFTTDERMQGLMEKIAYQLEVRVRQEVKVEEVLKGNLDESITVLQRSRELLEAWKSEYFSMRTILEESECNRRWEFDRRKLFRRTDYVASVCLKLEEVAKTIEQFKRFIQPKLRSVTRSRRAMNRLTCKLQALVSSFDAFCYDIFDERNAGELIGVVNAFRRQTEELENDCVSFLDTKFTRLRSALSAFKMLKDFTTTASRPKINAKLGEKFVDILQNFRSILWSSGLLQSLKTSVLAFKRLPELFDGVQAEIAFGNYLAFAKSITAYQKSLVKQWQVDAAAAASESLKAYILLQEANGTYAVNFSPELWVVMQEARHLNQLGVYEAPVAVLNVALHKERFYQHYVLLESLVEKLNSTLSSTLPAHKSLLSRQIAELHRAALPGVTTLNWTSLGLEDFVASCLKALTVFKAICEQVFKNVDAVEQIVKEIESSQLIRDLNWDSFAPFNIQVWLYSEADLALSHLLGTHPLMSIDVSCECGHRIIMIILRTTGLGRLKN